jgi:hypothetical protein
MDSHAINARLSAVVDEQLSEFDALRSAVDHVEKSSPSARQKVILCNNLVVGLTARIEEALREIFMEYLRVVEDCDASFFELKDGLQKSSFGSAIVALKKNGNWDEAYKKTKELHDLLSGNSIFKLAVENIVVTSREVVRVFLKQLWFQFVPVFHGLQGRSTMKN